MLRRATRCLLIVATFATCHAARAQFFVDLGKEYLDVPGCTFAVDSVILSFNGRSSIGSVHQGLANKEAQVYIQGYVDGAINDLIKRCVTARPITQHVVLKLNVLRIGEQLLATRELASCSIHCEFLSHDSAGWLRLYRIGTTVQNGGIDATNSHAANITSALGQCMERFQWRLNAAELHPVRVRDDQLTIRTPIRPMDIAGINGTAVPKGIFPSFMDFIESRPDTITAFDLVETGRSTPDVKVMRMSGEASEIAPMAWGLSDGERCYVNSGKDLIELKSDSVNAYSWLPPAKAYDKADLEAQMMFGLAGLALSRAFKDNRPQRYDLDLMTGQLVDHGANAREKETGVMQTIAYSSLSPVDTMVCLYLNGSNKVCLRRGQYFETRFPPQISLLLIELRVGNTAWERIYLDSEAEHWQVYRFNCEKSAMHVDHAAEYEVREWLFELDPAKQVR